MTSKKGIHSNTTSTIAESVKQRSVIRSKTQGETSRMIDGFLQRKIRIRWDIIQLRKALINNSRRYNKTSLPPVSENHLNDHNANDLRDAIDLNSTRNCQRVKPVSGLL